MNARLGRRPSPASRKSAMASRSAAPGAARRRRVGCQRRQQPGVGARLPRPMAPINTATPSPSSLGSRNVRNRNDGESAHCASSTAMHTGPAAARLAHSQYRPWSTANGGSGPSPSRPHPSRAGEPQQLGGHPGGALEHIGSLAARALRQRHLEQLAHDAERELALELAPRAPQQPHPAAPARPPARPEHRGLTDPGGTLDHQHPAVALPAAGQDHSISSSCSPRSSSPSGWPAGASARGAPAGESGSSGSDIRSAGGGGRVSTEAGGGGAASPAPRIEPNERTRSGWRRHQPRQAPGSPRPATPPRSTATRCSAAGPAT